LVEGGRPLFFRCIQRHYLMDEGLDRDRVFLERWEKSATHPESVNGEKSGGCFARLSFGVIGH
jgi:hypothetical protein